MRASHAGEFVVPQFICHDINDVGACDSLGSKWLRMKVLGWDRRGHKDTNDCGTCRSYAIQEGRMATNRHWGRVLNCHDSSISHHAYFPLDCILHQPPLEMVAFESEESEKCDRAATPARSANSAHHPWFRRREDERSANPNLPPACRLSARVQFGDNPGSAHCSSPIRFNGGKTACRRKRCLSR